MIGGNSIQKKKKNFSALNEKHEERVFIYFWAKFLFASTEVAVKKTFSSQPKPKLLQKKFFLRQLWLL